YASRETVWAELLGRHDQWVLVADAGGVAGFVHAGKNLGPVDRYTSEIYALYVAVEWQGKGVGTMLFGAAVERLLREGHRSLCLETLRAGPARPFYDRLGGAVLGSTATMRDGHPVEKVTYGWVDLDRAVEMCRALVHAHRMRRNLDATDVPASDRLPRGRS